MSPSTPAASPPASAAPQPAASPPASAASVAQDALSAAPAHASTDADEHKTGIDRIIAYLGDEMLGEGAEESFAKIKSMVGEVFVDLYGDEAQDDDLANNLAWNTALIATQVAREKRYPVPPSSGKPFTDRAVLRAAARYALFSQAAYCEGAKEIAKELGLPERHVHYVHETSAVGCPNFFIATDPASRALVVAVRGSASAADAITDASAANEPFLGGTAHAGILKSARQVADIALPEIKALFYDKLLTFFKGELPPLQLIITGHSLGASVAVLTMIILCGKEGPLHTFSRSGAVKCFAYAASPPFEPLSAIPDWVQDNTYSFIHEFDMVPRTTLYSVMRLLVAAKRVTDHVELSQSTRYSYMMAPSTLSKPMPRLDDVADLDEEVTAKWGHKKGIGKLILLFEKDGPAPEPQPWYSSIVGFLSPRKGDADPQPAAGAPAASTAGATSDRAAASDGALAGKDAAPKSARGKEPAQESGSASSTGPAEAAKAPPPATDTAKAPATAAEAADKGKEGGSFMSKMFHKEEKAEAKPAAEEKEGGNFMSKMFHKEEKAEAKPAAEEKEGGNFMSKMFHKEEKAEAKPAAEEKEGGNFMSKMFHKEEKAEAKSAAEKNKEGGRWISKVFHKEEKKAEEPGLMSKIFHKEKKDEGSGLVTKVFEAKPQKEEKEGWSAMMSRFSGDDKSTPRNTAEKRKAKAAVEPKGVSSDMFVSWFQRKQVPETHMACEEVTPEHLSFIILHPTMVSDHSTQGYLNATARAAGLPTAKAQDVQGLIDGDGGGGSTHRSTS